MGCVETKDKRNARQKPNSKNTQDINNITQPEKQPSIIKTLNSNDNPPLQNQPNEIPNINPPSNSQPLPIEQPINDTISVKILYNDNQTYSQEVKKDTLIYLVLDDFKRNNRNIFPFTNYVEYFLKDIKLTNINNPISTLLESNDNSQLIIEAKIHGLHNLPDFITNTIQNTTHHLGTIIKDTSIMLIIFNRNERCCSFDCIDQNPNNDQSTLHLISNFNYFSSLCNGNDHLFISGGESPSKESLNYFYDINLTSSIIKRNNKGMPFPKKFHSMIYIPNEYVFIIGGSDKNVFYYSIVNEEFHNWASLEKERLEPALSLVNDRFLYVFSNMKSESQITFEFTDLRGKSEWIVVIPKQQKNLSFEQTFFGSAFNSKNNTVIFFGGTSFYKDKNLIAYDIQNNELKNTSIKFEEIHLNEKHFIPFNEKYSFLIPNFNHFKSAKVITFNNITEQFNKIEFCINDKLYLKSSKLSKGTKNSNDVNKAKSIFSNDNAPPNASTFPRHIKTSNETSTNVEDNTNFFAFNAGNEGQKISINDEANPSLWNKDKDIVLQHLNASKHSSHNEYNIRLETDDKQTKRPIPKTYTNIYPTPTPTPTPNFDV